MLVVANPEEFSTEILTSSFLEYPYQLWSESSITSTTSPDITEYMLSTPKSYLACEQSWPKATITLGDPFSTVSNTCLKQRLSN